MADQPSNPDSQRSAEGEFLSNYDPSEFDRPSVAVDVTLLTQVDDELRVLVLRRDEHPHCGDWALPGGFVGMDESLDDAARRVLAEKAGLDGVFLEQLYSFGRPDRDPRMRVITIAYYALVDWPRLQRAVPDNADDHRLATIQVPWPGETGGAIELRSDGKPLPCAFDHQDIIGLAIKRLRGKLDYAPLGFQLLGEQFTLLQLQRVHETVLDQALNKDSFRRRMLASGQLEATGERQQAVGHRPAELYRFKSRSAL